jgi:hypothetical protein
MRLSPASPFRMPALLLASLPLWPLPAAAQAGAASSMAVQALAPVEARVPFAPTPFPGSDGLRHLAYELHVSDFYGDAGPLRPQSLDIYADDGAAPLARYAVADLAQMIRPSPKENEAPAIGPGRRSVFFIWLSLPADAPAPKSLRHRMRFATDAGKTEWLDNARITVSADTPPVLGPPLRGGRWLAHEGPGNAQSHHWGSLVAVNGALTIPQRYAFDLIAVDAQGHALRKGVKDFRQSKREDWLGEGAEVIAVADGTVRAARDGEEEHMPLAGQPEPDSLTTDGLYGNYVVLEIAPGRYAAYAHLQRGSVQVKAGQAVKRGQLLGRLGQSGSTGAPHLHFHLADAPAFEGSEGIPYVFERFTVHGTENEGQILGLGEPWKAAPATTHERQLPLNDVVIEFPR